MNRVNARRPSPTTSKASKGGARASASASATRRLYLDLLKRTLTGVAWGDPSAKCLPVRDHRGVRMMHVSMPFDAEARRVGSDFPSRAMTMVGLERLDQLQRCIEDVLARGVPGDFIETGVWRGGATIFMRGALEAFGDRTRRVFVADSFAGFPFSDPKLHPHDAALNAFAFASDVEGAPVAPGQPVHGDLVVSLDDVKRNFARHGLLDDRVKFLKGWFADTLAAPPFEELAIARLDGDLYTSTMDAIENLYPRLSVGGYLIVDDYALTACRNAITDYRSKHRITDPIEKIDWTGVYWKKTGRTARASKGGR